MKLRNWDWIYNFFAHYYNNISEQPKIHIVHRSDWKTTILASFLSKSLNYTIISSYLQKLSTFTIATFTSSTRTVFTLQTSVRYFRALRMCRAFNLDCRYDNSNMNFIGNLYSPKTMYWKVVCVRKKTFESLGRSHYQCTQGTSTCQVRNVPFGEQTNSFF